MLHALRHENIISLVGVISAAMPYHIVLELMEGGDLRSYLRNIKSTGNDALLPAEFITIALQVSRAMMFLEVSNIVHRDLAARNVLVGSGPEDVKLADFGLVCHYIFACKASFFSYY